MAGEMVWMDLEMTGLDLKTESIIEIATIITDGELNIIAQGPNLAIKVDDELLDNMDEWNTTHHTSSGLVDRVRNEGVTLQEAITQTCDFLKENIEAGTPPLCQLSNWPRHRCRESRRDRNSGTSRNIGRAQRNQSLNRVSL